MTDGSINYKLTPSRRKAVLLERAVYHTPITGHEAEIRKTSSACKLHRDGRLSIESGFVWDFGSFAVDTPAMVQASLAHDALCRLINLRLVPWSVRRQSDAYFRELLRRYQPKGGVLRTVIGFVSRWRRWAGVSAYSQLVARWRDRE